MPPIVQLTICYAAGIALTAAFAVDATTGWVLSGITAAVVFLPERRLSTFTLALPYGAACIAAGALAAHDALRAQEHDCRSRMVENTAYNVVLTLQQAPLRNAAPAQLDSIGGRACGGAVRLLLPAGAQALPAGGQIRAVAEWWPDRHDSPLAARTGSLLVRRFEPLASVDRTAALRGRAVSNIRALFGVHAPLVEALLVAQTSSIAPELKRDFAASGLSHLLAISGTHVALVAASVTLLVALARWPITIGILAGAVAAAVYVAFLGAPYPAVRSVVQLLLVVASRLLQRPAYSYALLAAAAWAILLYDPLALLDAGFQLSFAGLAGIMAARKRLIEILPQSVPLVIRDAIATTMAASLATTPVAAFHFGQVSVIAVAANLMALPLVSAAVPASAGALMLYGFAPAAAHFIADGARLLLTRFQAVAALAADVPGGHFFVTRTAVLVALTGLLLTHLLLWPRLHPLRPLVRGAVVAVLCALALPLANAAFARADRHSLEIHALNVGQGDATALRTPRGRWLLIDAGPKSDRFDAGASRVAPFLLRHGARTIELLVLTHPHLDHVGGASALMRMVRTATVMDPDSGRSARGALDAVLQARYEQWLPARAGRRMTIDSIGIEVLYPDARTLPRTDDANDQSLVIRVSYGRFAALFTGDAPVSVEEQVIEQYGRRVDVDLIKAGHHGSTTATGYAWLAATTPSIAIVSAGRGNRYGHPAPVVLERLRAAGVTVLRTDLEGTLSLRAYADGRVERMQ